MTQTVGTKGQVVIPKPLRERRGLEPGSPVTFEDHADGVLVRRASSNPEDAKLRGRFKGTSMAAQLLADRASEPR